MSKRLRPNHSLMFKAKVALAAVKGEKTLEQIPSGVNRGGIHKRGEV